MISAPKNIRDRSAYRVNRTSRTRWRLPTSSRICVWTRTPWSRPSCTTSSKIRRRPRPRSPPLSARWWPNWSTASASWTRSSSRTARKRKPRAFAKCCWRWCATSASSWSSSPTACTTCAPSASCRRSSAGAAREIYAPIAERLGLYAVKLELEDLGFRALYPYRYKVLERELKRARGNQKEFIAKIAETFKGALKKAAIDGAVEGREKHLYSIYKKMQNKKISINEMVDV